VSISQKKERKKERGEMLKEKLLGYRVVSWAIADASAFYRATKKRYPSVAPVEDFVVAIAALATWVIAHVPGIRFIDRLAVVAVDLAEAGLTIANYWAGQCLEVTLGLAVLVFSGTPLVRWTQSLLRLCESMVAMLLPTRTSAAESIVRTTEPKGVFGVLEKRLDVVWDLHLRVVGKHPLHIVREAWASVIVLIFNRAH
jgi:hypothetical protein